MLEARDLYVGYYKDLNILQGVSLTAQERKITTVLGANGVGKSTLLKAIYGFYEKAYDSSKKRRGYNNNTTNEVNPKSNKYTYRTRLWWAISKKRYSK